MKTLIVYRYTVIDIESHEMKEVWRAPYKDDASLVKAILEYSNQLGPIGATTDSRATFFCKVIDG